MDENSHLNKEGLLCAYKDGYMDATNNIMVIMTRFTTEELNKINEDDDLHSVNVIKNKICEVKNESKRCDRIS